MNNITKQNLDIPADHQLRKHAMFMDVQTMLEAGINVHVVRQTEENNLVVTCGALHQIINETQVEG
jgi:hypothetical protein